MSHSSTEPNAYAAAGKISEWVLVKNNQFIAFNKPAGLAVQPDKTGDKSLLQLAEIYCKSKLYPVHRLDRPASGVVVFAKTKNAAAALSEQFRSGQAGKIYLAAIGNLPPETEGTAVHFLQKNGRTNRALIIEPAAPGGREAVMKYRLVSSSERYHLLEIELLTGRHHQIRAQLAAMGCPIKGDVKYGFRRANPDRSIHLHAWKLFFLHPSSGEQVHVAAALPDDPVWRAFQFDSTS